MTYITTNPIKNSTIMLIFSAKDEIDLSPPYQRQGGIWTKEKKQLLIDSILNEYDLPKMYFHVLNRRDIVNSKYEYAVIDGRQRLEAIWGFIDGDYKISEDFQYQRDPTLILSGLSYNELAAKFPRIRIKFDSFVLPIVGIETEDRELIDDMFYRLNEAASLNAAEKRNAMGGYMVDKIREVAGHKFFAEKVAFSNNRYQHYEVAARLILLSISIGSGVGSESRIIDTKKENLDSMVKKYKKNENDICSDAIKMTINILEYMASVFGNNDDILRSQGNMPVYFLLFREALLSGGKINVARSDVKEFLADVDRNRKSAAENYEDSNYDLLEYYRLTLQGTNDASNIRTRLETIRNYIFKKNNSSPS